MSVATASSDRNSGRCRTTVCVNASMDVTQTNAARSRMRRGEILLHVCLHGTYHRGNAGALLQLRGLAPSPDAITDYLEDAA